MRRFLLEVFTFTRRISISGSSITFSVFTLLATCVWLWLSSLRPKTSSLTLLQGLFATSGISPFVVLAKTNFSISLYTGTLNHSQASSALHSTKVLIFDCSKIVSLLWFSLQGLALTVQYLPVTRCFLSCVLVNTSKVSPDSGCVQDKSWTFTLMGVWPFRDFSSSLAVTCFQVPAIMLFWQLDGFIPV